MKYLLTIILLILVSTVFTFSIYMSGDDEGEEDVVLSINGHDMTREYLYSGYHHGADGEGELEAVITREILIQEAQRLAIDKEEKFRIALKNYYEQSLIKVLTDRIYKSSKAEVIEQEIEQYLNSFGKRFTFTVYSTDKEQKNINGETRSVMFEELAAPLAFLLYDLETGKTVERNDVDGNLERIQLDKVEVVEELSSFKPSKKVVRQLLLEQKKEMLIAKWMRDLRNNASIVMYEPVD